MNMFVFDVNLSPGKFMQGAFVDVPGGDIVQPVHLLFDGKVRVAFFGKDFVVEVIAIFPGRKVPRVFLERRNECL